MKKQKNEVGVCDVPQHLRAGYLVCVIARVLETSYRNPQHNANQAAAHATNGLPVWYPCPPYRLESRCAICGLTDGAVMGCQQPGGCHTNFHVLCARNIGLYLSEHSPKGFPSHACNRTAGLMCREPRPDALQCSTRPAPPARLTPCACPTICWPSLTIMLSRTAPQPSGPTRRARARCSTAFTARCTARRSRQGQQRQGARGLCLET